MSIGINDIDDDLELDEGVQSKPNLEDEQELDKPWLDPSEDYSNPGIIDDGEGEDDGDGTEENDDLVSQILKSKGINPNSVKITNDAGEVEETDFNSLSREEQLEILNYNPNEEEYGLDDDEINLINELRSNNLSVQDFINYHKQAALNDYMSQQDTTQSFLVDQFSDDELFIADLKAKVPDLTDEEALQQLEIEKGNESLFTKKINGIRDTYKTQEQLMTTQLEQELAEQQRQEAAQYEDLITKTIKENSAIDLGDSSLELSEDDMDHIASFILDSDPAGVRHIAKALQDPKTMVKMAWFALKGDEALKQISSYYKQQITATGKANYQKGFSDAKLGKANSKTVVRKPVTKQNTIKSINDIDLD